MNRTTLIAVPFLLSLAACDAPTMTDIPSSDVCATWQHQASFATLYAEPGDSLRLTYWAFESRLDKRMYSHNGIADWIVADVVCKPEHVIISYTEHTWARVKPYPEDEPEFELKGERRWRATILHADSSTAGRPFYEVRFEPTEGFSLWTKWGQTYISAPAFRDPAEFIGRQVSDSFGGYETKSAQIHLDGSSVPSFLYFKWRYMKFTQIEGYSVAYSTSEELWP